MHCSTCSPDGPSSACLERVLQPAHNELKAARPLRLLRFSPSYASVRTGHGAKHSLHSARPSAFRRQLSLTCQSASWPCERAVIQLLQLARSPLVDYLVSEPLVTVQHPPFRSHGYEDCLWPSPPPRQPSNPSLKPCPDKLDLVR